MIITLLSTNETIKIEITRHRRIKLNCQLITKDTFKAPIIQSNVKINNKNSTPTPASIVSMFLLNNSIRCVYFSSIGMKKIAVTRSE
jgi:hypothetical protein